ncbi:glycerophosphodiester phosphodiesterase [Leifsonia sp. EB34]|uniref:glycerophosphodiester phosphodiesterase n=1 Tax=Leifsonia sp. EB34 TaxID=3156303 RepID=UPI003510F3FE
MGDDAEEQRGKVSRRAVIGVSVAAVAVVAAGAAGVGSLLSASQRSSGPMPASTGMLTVAHHGGSRDWPEMSMLGYRNSVLLGARALEVSLARTSDGVWFGLHDATLDRTSGTTDFVASEHTWAEVSRHRISASETTDPSQPAQPYARFEDIVAAFAATHVLYVDPKVVSATHFPELFAIMSRAPSPTRAFVAKGYCTASDWPAQAAARGYPSWGYYYASEVEADAKLLPSTQARWTTLGLDYNGSPAVWERMRRLGKPVLAHVVPDARGADTARHRGASGMVVSGMREVLSPRGT